jgi:predicted Zn finger-like uncharacterized protein
MKIVCDACQAKYSIADDKIQGKAFKIRCKKCNHIIVVKTGGEGAAASGAEKAKATSAPAPAPSADQAVWHVVIDGEQAGPMAEADVKEHVRQGKVNSDTLVWKEGFADWTALSAVPELAPILARVTQHPVGRSAINEPVRASASMKAVNVQAAAAPLEEADPFAAATVVNPTGAAEFMAASAPPQAVPAPVGPAPSSPFLFGGAPAQQPEIVVRNPSPGNGAGSTHLTGQRNENSVLFSLSNLEALAVPSGGGGGGIRPPSSTSNTEGSGLIDIRSMAAMTLNEGGGGESRRSLESLPTFSTPQFSPVAPVLLPMSSSGPPKWVYPVLGLLAVGILVLGYGIFKVVAAPPPGTPIIIQQQAPAPLPAAPAPAAQPAAPAPTPAAAEPAKPAVEEKPAATAEEKPAEKSDKVKSDKVKSDKGHRKSSEGASASKGSGEGKKGGETASSSSSSSDSGKSSGKRSGKSIDDMLGEVGNKKGGDDAPKPSAPTVKLVTLTQSDIVNAMKGVQPKVQNCANQFKVPGTAMANITVASGGKVSNATVTGKFAGTPTGSCIEQAAKSAKFPPCQGMTFPWPFTLSPR